MAKVTGKSRPGSIVAQAYALQAAIDKAEKKKSKKPEEIDTLPEPVQKTAKTKRVAKKAKRK